MCFLNGITTTPVIANFSYYTPFDTKNFIDKRTTIQSIVDHIFSLLREISYYAKNTYARIVDYFEPAYDQLDKPKAWKLKSEGLYIFLHGLSSHPCVWRSHLDELKNEKDIDTFAPYVPLQGNGPLKKVFNPILRKALDYATKHPRRPIYLVGASNGGRGCTWIQHKLRVLAPRTPIKISTIAAVHLGSTRMDFLKWCYEATGRNFWFHPTLVEELCFGSEKAKMILDHVAIPLTEGVVRDYEFFGSTEDSHVEISSSIPKLHADFNAVNWVVHGYDHGSIVEGVAQKQIEISLEWMKMISAISKV